METKRIITDKGRELVFHFYEGVEKDSHRGPIPTWTDDLVEVYVNGEDAGYVKLSYIKKESAKLLFPDILTFIQRARGNHVFPMGFLDEKTGPINYSNMTEEQLRKFVKSLTITLFGGGWQRQDAISKMNKEELLSTLKEYMLVVKKKFGKDYKKFIETYVDKPFVHYIKVRENFQKTGIAPIMYLITAKWLADRGMNLYAGGPQTDRAKHIWNRMEDRGWVSFDGTRRFIDASSI